MGRCKYYGICGLENSSEPDDFLCILHCSDPYKDRIAFNKALDAHRQKEKGSTNFGRMVFPYQIDFNRVTFSERVDF